MESAVARIVTVN